MPLRIGQTVGHYRILRALGAGGMGEVYEAEDAKLGRRVALKVLPEETARDPQRRERFEREARAVAALNHPGIVTIYSVEEADGIDFITMELIDGQTLRQTLPRGGLPLGRLLELAIPMSDAVAAAHRHGITHRDLKPENVLITRDGKVKVLDFGLAKVGAGFGGSGEDSRLPTRALTEEGRIVGTVAYMSPEQAEGKPVDPRSDVFTLGIILFEMSTGERPFKGDTPVSVLSSILKDSPPPVTQMNTTLPRDMARIVNRCLTKDPARRFQSALGLVTELEELRHDSDSGILNAIPTGGGRPAIGRGPAGVAGWIRGRARAVAAAAIVVVLAIAGWAILRVRRGEVPPAIAAGAGGETAGLPPAGRAPGSGPGAAARQRIVVLPFENLGSADDAYFASGVTDEIASRLASVGGLGVISRSSAVQYAGTGKTTRQIGAELGVDYLLTGTVRWQRGAAAGASRVRVTPQLVRVADDTQLWGDRYDREMKDIFSVQSEIAEQVVDKLGLAMREPVPASSGAAPTQNLDAYQLYLRGNEQLRAPESERDEQMQAVDLMEQAVRLDPQFAQAWAALSYAHSRVYHSRYDYTEERLAKARECADRSLALQPDLREGHLALGYYYYWGRGDYGQALSELGAAAGKDQQAPDALQAMAYVKRRQGRWEESLALMEKALTLNPRDIELIVEISGSCQTLRRFPEALRYADRAIALAPRAVGLKIGKAILQVKMDGNTRAAWETLKQIDAREFPELPGLESFLFSMDGRYREALERLAALSVDTIETQDFYSPKPLLVGITYLAMNDRARAREPCESARKMLEKEIARNPRDARLRSANGQALACLGRKAEAVREARLASDLNPMSTDAIDGPRYLEALAQVQAMVGEFDAAFDNLERLLSMPSETTINMLRLDPLWAPLRSHPRFARLVQKYG